jgi:hypothetical protein
MPNHIGVFGVRIRILTHVAQDSNPDPHSPLTTRVLGGRSPRGLQQFSYHGISDALPLPCQAHPHAVIFEQAKVDLSLQGDAGQVI